MKLFGLELPPGRNVEGWENWPVNAKQFALDSMKSWGLSKIVGIRAHLHKVVLCSDYLWGDFHAGPLGSLQYYHRNLGPGDKGHSRISVPHQFDTECRICTHPTKGFLPQSVIILVGPRVQDIRLFADHFGGSWISSVEYGLDMICANPGDAQNLFNLLKRYLYVRNLQTQKLFKPEEDEHDNRTIYYGNYKLYERGPNSMRRADGGWSLDHVDRVRWEYSAPGTELNKKGLFFVTDLLHDPRFGEVARLANQKLRFGFGKFDDTHPHLKKEWDFYYPEVDHQIGQCFQEEYFHQRRKLVRKAKKVSLSDYRVPATGFDQLISGIEQAIHDFAQSWEHETYEPI